MSNPAKYKDTVLKEYPTENADLGLRDDEYIKWELRCQDGTVVRSNLSLISNENPFIKLKYNYFVLDEKEGEENMDLLQSRPDGVREMIKTLQSIKQFTNLNRKNVYLLTFPIGKMMIRPREHLGVFTDSVLEYIPILLRQQGTPIKMNDAKLKKYQERWKTPAKHLYNTIQIEELKAVLEDFDIDKGKISLVSDPVHNMTAMDMLQKGSDPIYSINPDGEVVLDVFQAVLYIFQSLVCGIDWTTKSFKDQLQKLKMRVLKMMTKYGDLSENLCISKKSIDGDIQVLKSDRFFLQQKKAFEHWSELNCLDTIPTETVTLPLKSFGISIATSPDSPLFVMGACGHSEIQVWKARWLSMNAWVDVFFDKNTEKLAKIVRDALFSKVPEDVQKMSNAMANEMAPRHSSEALNVEPSMNSTSKYKGSKWKEMGYLDGDFKFLQGDPVRWQLVTPEGLVFRSNNSFLALHINNTSNPNYFILDSEDQKNLEQFLISKNDLPKEEREMLQRECCSSLTKFSNYCPKNIYIRSFLWAEIKQMEFRVFIDDVLEAIPIILKQQKTPLKGSDDRLKKLHEKWKPEASHLYNSISDSEFYQILEDFDINKEKVTKAADIFHFQSAASMNETGVSPIIVYSPRTEIAMDISQALLYTFQSLICGINWETSNYADYTDFKEKVLVVMRNYADLKEGSFITKEYVDSNIRSLKDHCVYMERMDHEWPDYRMSDKEPTDKISSARMSRITTELGLPQPTTDEPEICIWQCRYFTMLRTAKFFFGDEKSKIYRLTTGAMIHIIPKENQNVFRVRHIVLEIEDESVKKSEMEEKNETKITPDTSKPHHDDFEKTLRKNMRKKKEQKKQKAEEEKSPGVSIISGKTEQKGEMESPVQKEPDAKVENKMEILTLENEKLKGEVAKLKEKLQKLKVASDSTKSSLETELSKKFQELENLSAKLKERDVEITNLQSSKKPSPNNSEQLQQELAELSRINSELRDTNLRLSARNEEQARVMENLLDRLTRPRTN